MTTTITTAPRPEGPLHVLTVTIAALALAAALAFACAGCASIKDAEQPIRKIVHGGIVVTDAVANVRTATPAQLDTILRVNGKLHDDLVDVQAFLDQLDGVGK